MQVLPGQTYRVRLVDTGEVREVGLDSVRRLPDEMAHRNAFCHCVKLRGVRALGTSDGSWPMSTIEALKDTVRSLPFVYLAIRVSVTLKN